MAKPRKPVILMAEHGLPELPAGYFWRVSTPDYCQYWPGIELSVEIHQKRFIGSKRIRSSYVSTPPPWADELEISAAHVLDTAIKCLSGWNEEKTKVRSVSALIGDYPPKRLEV